MQQKEGTAESSFVESSFRRLEHSKTDPTDAYDLIKFAAGGAFAGAADTVIHP